LRQKAATP